MPDLTALGVCIRATLIGARIAARFANEADPKRQNQATGLVLCLLGGAMILVKLFS